MDGEFTLNENVCDIDGLNIASEAFVDLREASANDLVHLPNNPYTPQQLFFINTAQVSLKKATGHLDTLFISLLRLVALFKSSKDWDLLNATTKDQLFFVKV